jgi:hypothetical protein
MKYHREGTIGENHPMTNRLGRRILPRQRDGVQDKRVGGANDWQGGPVEIFINKVASIVLKNAFSVWCGEVSSILNAPTLLSTAVTALHKRVIPSVMANGLRFSRNS